MPKNVQFDFQLAKPAPARPAEDHVCHVAGCGRPAVFGQRAGGVDGLREPVGTWACSDHVPPAWQSVGAVAGRIVERLATKVRKGGA